MDRDLMRNELLHDEGLRLTPYKDSLGFWTIGVGHLLHKDQSVPVPRMTSITYSEAMALLDVDINIAYKLVQTLVPQGATNSTALQFEVRCRALTNMAFNLGPKLEGFHHFLDAVRAGNWDDASRYMMESLWAKQVGLRANRLQHMIQTGEVG